MVTYFFENRAQIWSLLLEHIELTFFAVALAIIIGIPIGILISYIKKLNKPMKGHFTKVNVTPKKHLREFRVDSIDEVKVGDELKADVFAAGEKIDIQGTSKGKGFQGVIKRHGQHRGPMGHGSMYHRRPGSMGPTSTPGRVFKGKKLPGHMGKVTVTIQNLEVVAVDLDKNVILVKGSVPGNKGAILKIRNSVKSK